MSGKLNPVITSDGRYYFLTVGKNTIQLNGLPYRIEKLNIVDAKGEAIPYQIKARVIGTRVKDTLNNYVDNAIILGDTGDDSIYSFGNNVSISSGAGNDDITNGGGSNVTVNAGAGNDNIRNLSGSVTIDGGAGNDYTGNRGENVSIYGGAGNDSIENSGTKVTVDGGAGKDSISNNGANVSINADAGNDYIENSGSNVSIYGGAGNDSISLDGYSENNLVVYKTGDGKDQIEGFSVNDSIKIIGTTKFSGTVNENDVVLTIGKGSITLKDAAEKKITFLNSKNELLAENIYLKDGSVVGPSVTLKADVTSFDMGSYTTKVDASKTTAGVHIYSTTYPSDNLTILGGKGNDTLNGYYGADSITGGAGDDSIYGDSGNDSLGGGAGNDSLDGGYGDDSLYGEAGNDSLNGGSGNDFLDGGSGSDTLDGGYGDDSLYGEAGNDSLNGGYGSDTLWGGAGDDTLTGGGNYDVFVYKPNEGTDTITDYYYYTEYSCDVLQILKADGSEGGAFTDSNFSDNKLTLTIDGGGSVVFNGVYSYNRFNINGTTYQISGSTLVRS